MTEKLLTVSEAAFALGVAESTIYKQKDEGRLRVGKSRGALRIPESEVARKLKERRESEDALSVQDVAKRLRCSPQTVRRMCHESFTRRRFYFKCFRSPRGGWRINRKSFDTYLQRSFYAR